MLRVSRLPLNGLVTPECRKCKSRQECRDGTQECVRHYDNRHMRLAIIAAAILCLTAADVAPQSRRLRADLELLTSDALKGRVSLSPEADAAARYIAASFERSGLKPAATGSYLQEFPLIAFRADPSRRALKLTRAGVDTVFRPGPDFTGAFSRDVRITAPVVFVGYGISAPEYGYDDYANIDVTGKIVLMFDHEPQKDNPRSIFNGTGHTLHAGRSVKIATARRHGAVAVLIAGLPPRAGANQGQPLRASAPTQALDNDDADSGVFGRRYGPRRLPVRAPPATRRSAARHRHRFAAALGDSARHHGRTPQRQCGDASWYFDERPGTPGWAPTRFSDPKPC